MKVELETAFSQLQLNDQDFGTIATFMYRETGIVLNDSKRYGCVPANTATTGTWAYKFLGLLQLSIKMGR